MSRFLRMLLASKQTPDVSLHGRARLGLDERKAQDALRPRTGHVDVAPQVKPHSFPERFESIEFQGSHGQALEDWRKRDEPPPAA